MKSKDLINYKNLSIALSGNDNSIRKNSHPKKYDEKISNLEDKIEQFISEEITGEYYTYKITNPKNECYIGFTVDFERRIQQHKNTINKGNSKLQKSLKNYGIDNHKYEIIEKCKFYDNVDKERYWQLYYDSIENGLNTILNDKIPIVNLSNKMGRKLKYDTPTVLVSFRVPVSHIPRFKLLVKNLMKEYENESKQSDNLKNECDCHLDSNGFLRRGKIKCTKSKSEHKF